MIRIENLTKSFDGAEVLRNISLTVADSSVYGLVGRNGAGKTTLLNIVAGFYTPSEGHVLIETGGTEREPFDSPDIKRELFYLTDDMYFPPLSTLDDLEKYYKGFYPSWKSASFSKLIALFGLDRRKRIAKFSKGMKRQAAIIIAFSTGARYILMDETFDGLDPDKRKTVRDLITEYMCEVGATVIISSHNLFELESICDTVGMIEGKRLVFSSDIEQMKESIFGFCAIVDADCPPSAFDGLRVKRIRHDGGFISFYSEESEETIKERIGAYAGIRKLDIRRLSLEEIFEYVTEESGNETKNIFK